MRHALPVTAALLAASLLLSGAAFAREDATKSDQTVNGQTNADQSGNGQKGVQATGKNTGAGPAIGQRTGQNAVIGAQNRRYGYSGHDQCGQWRQGYYGYWRHGSRCWRRTPCGRVWICR